MNSKGTIISVTTGESYIEAWRKFLAKRIEDSGAKYAGIIKALTIGDTTGLDEKTKELFLRTGTSHILAISGSNIGIVTAFFFFIARMLLRTSLLMRLRGDDKKYAALFSIPFAILFMLTAGSSIPIIRATIMITVYMLALYFETNETHRKHRRVERARNPHDLSSLNLHADIPTYLCECLFHYTLHENILSLCAALASCS